MRYIFVTALALFSFYTMAKQVNKGLNYPKTSTVEQVDTYFGTLVRDPYRWLEDDYSEKTKQWVKAQNAVTFSYLNAIPYRQSIEKKLTNLWNYPKRSAPIVRGAYMYYSKNSGLQNQNVLYRQPKNGGKEEIFLDPNTFSENGTTALSSYAFSKDGSLFAYSTSKGGSDWRDITVIRTSNKKQVGSRLENIKFSAIAWEGNSGFYYSTYPKPKGSMLSEKTNEHSVFFHRLDQNQGEDKKIFGGKEGQIYRYVFAQMSEDERYLIIAAANTTSGNLIFIKDMKSGSPIRQITHDIGHDHQLLHSIGNTLFFKTNKDAPNGKIASYNTDSHEWKTVVAETKDTFNASSGGGYLFLNYKKDAISHVQQYNWQGKLVRNIKLPGVGTVNGFNGKDEQKLLYFSFTNYATPTSLYSYDVKKQEMALYWKPEIVFDSSRYKSEQVFYTSKDGTKVPMIITYKKGIKRDGNNPTILYGYGGFNISLNPRFSPSNATWLELGGVYAVANLRGGGEYGKKWHLQGVQTKKQNVFDDFIAAAEYLTAEKYTSNKKLAIQGGSNGGLLVGATMLQRPDLFQVALPAVGVLDMLRYHTFTSGAGWAYDFGTAEDSKEMFEYLYTYSPVHNVKKDTVYPATLITTADHDDRVVPAHSFKFAAQLQAKKFGVNPRLIRIETNAGHGAGKSTQKRIQESADIIAFTLYNMGYRTLP